MILNLVKNKLLHENNIHYQDVVAILSELSESNCDYADLYFQSIFNESWILEDKIVKSGMFNIDQGIGVRVIDKKTTAFAYTDKITLSALKNVIKSVKVILDNKINKKVKVLNTVINNMLYECNNPVDSLNFKEKIDILYYIDTIARSLDTRVVKVNAVLSSKYEHVLIASTDENIAADIRPLVNISISILVEDHGKREKGSSGGGSRTGYSYFFKKHDSGMNYIKYLTNEAVRIALVNLSAQPAPSGLFPVVLGPGWPGVLIHEAIGHGLEGDFNYRGTSVFTNKIGIKVASSLCTIVDDGTIMNKRGSLSIDDEGVPTQYNVLIKNGVLKSYMQDKLHASLMGTKSTGNGRRESYAHLPMPRMTNTYMLPGLSKPKDIIKTVEYGVFASNFGGGQVDITSGKFVFSTSEAYLIKKGKLITPILGATLIGSGIESMNQISMVGDDLLIDEGVGMCIKNGQ
ncbi:MAG TPA: metalloprotease TldD, partial [Buchnera sp. (in: enterobacteria)]|nr:metalloprotease TldD [Buchnera sp. (in: enterobacteria)]